MKAVAVLFLAVTALSQSVQAVFTPTDIAVMQFALNLECLEAEFYSWAAFGDGLNKTLRGGGPRAAGGKRALLSPSAVALARDIATDEITHVAFLHSVLKSVKSDIPCPKINIGGAFAAAANAAIGTTLKTPFTPYGNDALFLHGAFIFEDVGVTAYHGAVGLISPALAPYAVGILGTEAYHAGAVRSKLMEIAEQTVFPYGVKVKTIVGAISALRGKVGGGKDAGIEQLVPADENAIVFSRTTRQVLNIVFLGGVKKGGFFPNGVNGAIQK